MKTYPKNKFYFLKDTTIKENGVFNIKWTKIDPVEGDIYYNEEYEWKWPFLKKRKNIVIYKLINDLWVEQEN